MATAKQAMAAAKRKWGKRAFVRENKNSMTPAQREDRTSHVKALNEQVQRIDAELKTHNYDWTVLLKAAEFCRDVNAQEPSLSQLGEAATAARSYLDMKDERRALNDESKRLGSGLHVRRWDAGYIGTMPGLGNYLSCDCSADTLDELLEKISRERSVV